MKYSSLLVSLIIFIICIITAEAIELVVTDPCTATLDPTQQKLSNYDAGVTVRSTKACYEACNDSNKNDNNNGMCILEQCYCTDVGVGTCQDNNHEGCDAICQNLSLDWIGVCSDGDCHCIY